MNEQTKSIKRAGHPVDDFSLPLSQLKHYSIEIEIHHIIEKSAAKVN